jgi:transcriptional regulator with XRE-family HTH domain
MVRASRKEQAKRRLVAARALAGLSQIDTAAKAGMPLTRYWRIENGYDEPTQRERERLARALSADESALWAKAS